MRQSNKDLGKWIQHLRPQGTSQAEVAEAVGISRTYYNQIENGKAAHVSFALVSKIVTHFGYEIDFGAIEATSTPLVKLEAYLLPDEKEGYRKVVTWIPQAS